MKAQCLIALLRFAAGAQPDLPSRVPSRIGGRNVEPYRIVPAAHAIWPFESKIIRR